MAYFLRIDDNDVESSKRRVTLLFLSLMFLLKCMSKSIVIKSAVNVKFSNCYKISPQALFRGL